MNFKGTLYGWSIKRAGAAMTILHATGKIAGIDFVGFSEDGIYATKGDDRYLLESPEAFAVRMAG